MVTICFLENQNEVKWMVLFKDLLHIRVITNMENYKYHIFWANDKFWCSQKGQAPQSVICACCLDNWKIETLGLSYGCCLIIQGQGLPTGTHYHTDYGLWWTPPCPFSFSCCPHGMAWHIFLTLMGTQLVIKNVLPVPLNMNLTRHYHYNSLNMSLIMFFLLLSTWNDSGDQSDRGYP